MSAASIALAAGLSTLLSNAGETLTFRGGSVLGLVDRVGYRGREGQPDFTARDMSRIEIATDAVSPDPRAGEVFTDENGVNHRIQTIRRANPGLVMDCKTQA